MSQSSQSLGQKRVRVSFNPTEDAIVKSLKEKTADLIDLIESLKTDDGKDPRLASLAQTAYEEACMWAVKCATS